MPVIQFLFEGRAILLGLVVVSILIVVLARAVSRIFTFEKQYPTVNRRFVLEPGLFARLRWAFNSQKILEDAYAKYDGQVYRIARGDVDIVVVPADFIPELNRLPQNMINSRMCHAYSMIGHLNGMDVVLETQLHVKTLLQRISPALPELLKPASARIGEAIDDVFPQSTLEWTSVQPIDKVVYCVSRVITLASVGTPTCDNPDLIRLAFEHTKHVFTVMFIMRLIPAFLQPFLVWLLPVKWRLRRSMKELEHIIVPEAERRRMENLDVPRPDLLSWMVKSGKNEKEKDPYVLTQLLAALNSGGTYSSANFIVSVILDLVANPMYLEMIREEIRSKHTEVTGNWDFAAFYSLPKLDSAMKETARLSPGSSTTFSRVLLDDYTMSNGVHLNKGQFICVSSHCRSTDPARLSDPDKYDALRDYNRNFDDHIARPLQGVYGDEYRWGAGRWACAGRFLATMIAKVILVKLLDEYEFDFTDGRSTRPPNSIVHEFLFIHPDVRLSMRRREKNSGITF